MTLTFKQFLSEKISTSGVGRKITREIWADFPKQLEKLYGYYIKRFSFYVYKKDQDAQVSKEAKEQDKGLIKGWLKDYLKRVLEKAGNDQFEEWGHQNGIRVWFEKLHRETTNGTWNSNGRNLMIKEKYLDDLVDQTWEYFIQFFLDSYYEEKADRFDMPGNADKNLEDIIEIFVHELTHAHQTYRIKKQTDKKGKSINDYNSYLIKNKKKFYEAINDEFNRNHDAYLTSPQEIEAFAQELVHRMLKYANHDEPSMEMDALEDILKDFNTNMKWSESQYDRYKGSDKRVFIKARQRFLKKVYKELDQRYEDIKKEVEAEKKKNQE